MRFYHVSKTKAPSVVVAPDPVHGRQKRAILRAFSEPALKSHERLLRPFVDTLMQKLQQIITEERDHAVDMTEWYNYVMFDFMSLELFGESLGCLEQGTYHPWVDMLFGSIKALNDNRAAQTSVAVASWAAYQSSSNFKDPQLFLPERWLGPGQGEEDVKAAMQPFSVGPRACPGRSLAYAEASLILARLIWQFDLELLPECFNWADQRAYIIWDKPPLLIKLTPRA
ncbi:hypothetical protein APSETT445_006707 [Aspergillus pseudonomiae]